MDHANKVLFSVLFDNYRFKHYLVCYNFGAELSWKPIPIQRFFIVEVQTLSVFHVFAFLKW